MTRRPTGSLFYKAPRIVEAAASSKPKGRGVIGFAGRLLKRIFLFIGGVLVFSFMTGFIIGLFLGGGKTLPDDMILAFNITDPIGEAERAPSLADPLAASGMTVSDLVGTLDRAALDGRVRGILVSLDNAGIELAHIQEVRAAIHRFRAAGKFAYIYTSSFADLGSGIGAYYLAAAFDKIWMQPVGMVSMTGLSLEFPFARDALDKIGANPQFLQREEYKSAMESLTSNQMSEPNREAMQSILDDLSRQIVADIAKDRGITPDVLQAQIDRGLLTGRDALKEGVIDHLDYADILVDKTREAITGATGGEEPPIVLIEDYFSAISQGKAGGEKANTALVRISGEIVPGSDPEPGYATGDYIASGIMEAADDDTIRVIVVRVDSPGGSPSASETIRRSMVYAKEKGKKVIVSMGPMAASGGYWVAVDADRIFALPSTLTGSIGVIMGKFELSALWGKIGVNWDSLSWGKNARLWSMNAPMSEGERQSLDLAIDDTYELFIERVSEGRKLSPDTVRALAKGRAWTGVQAQGSGLVDALGGLDSALDYAAEQIGLSDRSKLDIRIMPEPLTPLEQFMSLLGVQVSAGYYPEKIAALFGAVLPQARKAEVMTRLGPVQVYDLNAPVIRP